VIGFRIAAARVQSPQNTPPFHTWRLLDEAPWTEFYRNDGGYLLRFPDIADFQVSADGFDIVCHPVPSVPEATSLHLYLNQVLPLALSTRGKLVFHASAVEVAGSAIVFAAESGRGKSTLAAIFAVGGFRLLTDDGLVVEANGNAFEILPSHPSIRLWGDSQEALLPPDANPAPAVHYTSKARFLAGGSLRFCDQPQPLRRVYFLGGGSVATLEIERLSPAEALIGWIKNSFLLDVEDKCTLASHFRQVADLAKQPIHYHLDYPRRYEEMEKLRQTILEHARNDNETT
jgi:hypothetical protein